MANIYNMTDTWTDGTTLTAIKMNVTDSSSAADSKLLDLQVGGSSKLTVGKDGAITAVSAGSVIPFYFANQAAFPSASTYHGALAHSHADGAMYFAHGGNWLELVNADDSGNVGIGTDAPDAKLHVRDATSGAGRGIHIGTGSVGASDDAHVLLNGRANYGYEGGQIVISDKNVNGTSTSKNFKISLYDSDQFYIDGSAGRVGIGTSSPSSTLDVNGSISDDVSDVRTPRYSSISTATTIADEGVYYCASNPTLTLGAPAAGAVLTIYNNSASSMTLNRGSTVTNMRIGGDNNTTNKTSVTLGGYSTAVVTLFSSTFAVVTGTDVT